jgi:hypothetical protein
MCLFGSGVRLPSTHAKACVERGIGAHWRRTDRYCDNTKKHHHTILPFLRGMILVLVLL